MARRSSPRNIWNVGFIGTGNAEPENVKDLLEAFLPDQYDYNYVIPDSIPRASKGLKHVWNLLDTWQEPYTKVPAHDIVDTLLAYDNSETTYLIALWDNDNPDDQTAEIIENAIASNVQVKNLCDALDDMVIEEEGEPETPKQRGKPRDNGPTMEIAGPATIVSETTAGDLLKAIKAFIREEVSNMGLSIGHNTFQSDLPEQDAKIKAWYSEKEDTYVRAEEGRKAPRGKKTVEITKAEADQLGI